MKMLNVRVTQKGVDVLGFSPYAAYRALSCLKDAQTAYLARAWATGKDEGVTANLPGRTRAHLRLLSVYNRSHGKPVPVIEGILFPKGMWGPFLGGLLVNKEIPILFPPDVSPAFTPKAIRVFLLDVL